MVSLRRFAPEIAITALVCAVGARYLAPSRDAAQRQERASESERAKLNPSPDEPARPDPPKARSKWNIDGVTPGMTCEQVVKVLGLPSRLKSEKDGWFRLTWGKHNTVFFQRGIAFACFGESLYKGASRIEAHAKELPALKKALGKGRESGWVTQWWWPDIQVGSTFDGQFVQLAPAIGEPSLENKESWQYPWSNDWSDHLALDGVMLGERRRKMGDGPAQIELSRSGFVVAVTGRELRYDAFLDHHNMSEGPFQVGDPVDKIRRWAPPGVSLERFRSKEGHVEVQSSHGKITSLKLVLDEPELIQMLDRQVTR